MYKLKFRLNIDLQPHWIFINIVIIFNQLVQNFIHTVIKSEQREQEIWKQNRIENLKI